MKRAVANILYEDPPAFFYDGKADPVMAEKFDLSRRVMGEDAPPLAHSMIGIRRLDNIASCVDDILANNVPGDVLEAGVLRGGAAIFLAACLRAPRRLGSPRVRLRHVVNGASQFPALVRLFLPARGACRASPGTDGWCGGGSRRSKAKSFPEMREPSDQLTRFVMLDG